MCFVWFQGLPGPVGEIGEPGVRVSHLSYNDNDRDHDESGHEHYACFCSPGKSLVSMIMIVTMNAVRPFFSPW